VNIHVAIVLASMAIGALVMTWLYFCAIARVPIGWAAFGGVVLALVLAFEVARMVVRKWRDSD